MFAYRARNTGLQPPRNVSLQVAVVVSLVAQLPLVAIPALRSVFGVGPLPAIAMGVGGRERDPCLGARADAQSSHQGKGGSAEILDPLTGR